MLLRNIASLALLLSLMGCYASSVDSLRANPGRDFTIETDLDYKTAYEKLVSGFRLCSGVNAYDPSINNNGTASITLFEPSNMQYLVQIDITQKTNKTDVHVLTWKSMDLLVDYKGVYTGWLHDRHVCS